MDIGWASRAGACTACAHTYSLCTFLCPMGICAQLWACVRLLCTCPLVNADEAHPGPFISWRTHEMLSSPAARTVGSYELQWPPSPRKCPR